LGYRVELTCLNHSPRAIATHKANFPPETTRHLCTGIDEVRPQDLYPNGEQVDLLLASPECTHHSRARGGKPINDQSRAAAFLVVEFIQVLAPRLIILENVEEFRAWSPLGANLRPLKSKKGAIFNAWFAAIEAIGYRGAHRVLCSADHGDPTTRERLFIQFVRGRRSIVWPEPTHAKNPQPDLFGAPRKHWVPARSIIDWSKPGKSIFERKKPLSAKTLARIEVGLRKFGLNAFLTPGQGERATQTPRTHSVEDPVPTVTATGHLHVVQPFLVSFDHGGSGSAPVSSADRPLSTITTKARHGVAEPSLVKLNGSRLACAEPFLIHTAHAGQRRPRSLEEPMPTVAGNRGDVALIEPGLLPQQSGGCLRPVSLPTPTIATAGAIALIQPFLVKYYGTSTVSSIDQPVPTVTTKPRFGLARPLITVNGEHYELDVKFRILNASELKQAMGFPPDYVLTGTQSDQVRCVGNAVSHRLARNLIGAAITQNPNFASEFSFADAA
jgi:DNA (cytosine-5)-methyltransferase 1